MDAAVGCGLGRRGRVTGRDADGHTAARARRVEGCRRLPGAYVTIRAVSNAHSASTRFTPAPPVLAPSFYIHPARCRPPASPSRKPERTLRPSRYFRELMFGSVVRHACAPDQLTSRRGRRDPVPLHLDRPFPASQVPRHVVPLFAFSSNIYNCQPIVRISSSSLFSPSIASSYN